MRVKLAVLALGLVSLLGLIGWQAYGLWRIKQGRFLDDSQLKLRTASVQESGMGLEQIATLHLFGNAADKPAAAPVPTDLPKTDLKLVLVGAITDSDPKQASALIEADKLTRRYYVGDNIPGGAVLHEVLSGSVVLKRENRYETLEFPKGSEATNQTRAAVAGFGLPVPTSGSTASVVGAPAAKPAAADAQPASQSNQPKGLTLRERLQKTPRVSQKAPGSP